MAKLWPRLLSSLTKGVDMGVVVMKSSLLSLLSCLFTLPYFYYLIFRVEGTVYRNPWSLLFTQLVLLLLICFLSAFIGFSFEKRYNLKGFGQWDGFVRNIPGLLMLGLLMIAVSCLFFDRHFFLISPDSYPTELFYLVTMPFKAAFTEEVILRLCMVTLGIGIFRNQGISLFVVSCLASLYSLKYFGYIGISVEFNSMFVASFVIAFAANMILGAVFIRKGLLSCMFLKFVFSMKYWVVALLVH